MHIDRPDIDVPVARPYRVEQPFARENTTWIFHQVPQQAELGRAKLDGPACPANTMRIDVHFKVAEGQRFAGQRRANAAQYRTHSSEQLARAERLGHIIVRAGLKAADAITLLTTSSEHDNRDMRGSRTAAKTAANLYAADTL